MRFRVVHKTDYAYDAPVALGPHIVRLRPRSEGTLHILAHDLRVEPTPAKRSDQLDLHGNSVTQLWFSGTTTQFSIESALEVETTRANPFDFLLDPKFVRLPVAGPTELAACRAKREALPATIIDLSDQLARQSGGDTLDFLSALSGHLYRTVVHELRQDGDPHPPETTLVLGAGACRDIAMLFLAACRAQGSPGVSSAAIRRTASAPTGICMPGPRSICRAAAGAATIPHGGSRSPIRMRSIPRSCRSSRTTR